MLPTAVLGPPMPSAKRVAEKKLQEWSDNFYKGDGAQEGEGIGAEDCDFVGQLAPTLTTYFLSDIRRQTTIISSPKLVKKGFFYSNDNVSEISEEAHQTASNNHLMPTTPIYMGHRTSSLSFIDNTVVFVAGTSVMQSNDRRNSDERGDESFCPSDNTIVHNKNNDCNDEAKAMDDEQRKHLIDHSCVDRIG
jgi:hypothetical protein